MEKNQYIIFILIILFFIIYKLWINNLFVSKNNNNGISRLCKNCGNEYWKSNIVGYWSFYGNKNHKNHRNYSCKCNKYYKK